MNLLFVIFLKTKFKCVDLVNIKQRSAKFIWINFLFTVIPEKPPTITGVNDGGKVKVGETITAICTSWESNPPANLSWFINGEPVSL